VYSDLIFGIPNASAEIVAEDATGNAVLFVYDKGDTMFRGFIAPAKRTTSLLPDGGAGMLNADGLTLLDATINESLAR